MKIKIAYFGTPSFAADFLEKLVQDTQLPIEISFVVTQPDQPVGRKQVITPSPVKVTAQKHTIPIFNSSSPELLTTNYQLLSTVDLALVYAYGKIIPPEILRMPKHGFWNIHPSLLPKYRGPSPIAYPLIMGDVKTGVSIIKLDSEMDHGPILSQVETELDKDITRTELENKLTHLGLSLLPQLINQLRSGVEINAIEQDHKKATYTRLLKKDDGFVPLPTIKKALSNKPLTADEVPQLIQDYMKKNYISFNKIPHFVRNDSSGNSSKIVFDYFRGLSPWPGIWTTVTINGQHKRLKIIDMSLVLHPTSSVLHIDRVQLEGKGEVDFQTFQTAYKDF